MPKAQAETFKRVLLGICVGACVFLLTDFVVSRRAEADSNVRQDAEIAGLRRDMTRMEEALGALQQTSFEILKIVKEK